MRINLFYVLCFSLLTIAGQPLLAQQTSPSGQGEHCAADANHEHFMATDPTYRKGFLDYQERLQQRIAAGKIDPSNKTGMQNSGSPFVIPTVVHVVWGAPGNNGDDSVSVEQVKSQFPALFRDFRNVPGTIGHSPRGHDTGIEFDLATIDPNGNPTNGIVYHFDPDLASHERIDEQFDLKDTYQWDKLKYYNVYLVGSINNQGQGGITLGYAQFPNPSQALVFDGVVVRSDAFGTTGNLLNNNEVGRTMTHEYGHSFNLFHPFQGGCPNSPCNATGDRVCDTPPASQQTFGAPNARINSCVSDIPDEPDDLRLYMDYTDDSYVNHFSHEQYLRMRASLMDPAIQRRFNLWQDANLQATGTGKYKAPEAGFHAKLREVHAGDSVQFREFSQRQPTSYQWNFFGGTADDPTAPNPVVTYSSPGTYDVQLIVDNLANQPDTLLMKDYVTVEDTSFGLPFAEGFEDPGLEPPETWTLLNNDDANVTFTNRTWDRSALAGGFGNSSRSVRMAFSNYNHYDARDELITPTIDFSGVDPDSQDVELSFDVSYEPLRALQSNFSQVKGNLLFSDTLEVLATTNGGLTWTSVFKEGGNDLAWDGDRTLQIVTVPSSNAWKNVRVQLGNFGDFAGEPRVRLMFRAINGYGNNLFMDNVELDTVNVQPTGTEDALTAGLVEDLRLIPNPTRGQFELAFGLKQAQPLQLRVFDLQGRLVTKQQTQKPAGKHRLTVDLADRPAGIYLVRFLAGDRQVIRRVVKQ